MEKNDKKTIAIVVKYFYPVTAGIETTVLETFSLLARQGWRVTVHASRDLYLEKNVLAEQESISGLEIRRYRWGRFGFWPKIAWSKTGAVVLENFNVFPHFQIMLMSWFLQLVGRKRYGLFLTPHGGFNPEWKIFNPVTALIKRIYHRTIGAALINLAVDGVQAVSEWEKTALVKGGIRARKIVVIPNGLEKAAFSDPAPLVSGEFKRKVAGFNRYLLQIGRVYMIKNYETTIRALANLPADVNFIIAGPVHDDKYQAELARLAESLGVRPRVIFIGVIKGAEKYYLIRQARLMVHMALWESFCCVVLEGMSQGQVCIAADNTALPYLIKDRVNGYLVKTTDHAALAAKIKYVLDNEAAAEITRIRRNSADFTRDNTWLKAADQVERFYNEEIMKI